jgi:hypothetical protein
MKLIFENWRQYLLTESITKELVTKWTRLIISILTKMIEDKEDDSLLLNAFGLKTNFQNQHWHGALGKHHLSKGEIPEDLKGTKAKDRRTKSPLSDCDPGSRRIGIAGIEAFSIMITFEYPGEDGEPPTSTSGGFESKDLKMSFPDRPELGQVTSKKTQLSYKLYINTKKVLTVGLFKQQLQNIQKDTYRTLAHEFHHARQTKSGFFGPKGEISVLDTESGYYFSPHEVEAFARGFYEVAKRTGTTFEEEVDDGIEKIKKSQENCISKFEEKIGKGENVEYYTRRVNDKGIFIGLLPTWKKALFLYAKRQLPCAQRINGEPIWPPGCRKNKNKKNTQIKPRETETQLDTNYESWYDKFTKWLSSLSKSNYSGQGGSFDGGGASDDF